MEKLNCFSHSIYLL